MNKVLVFKTASDSVMERLFLELDEEKSEKFCFIQTSLLPVYKKKYTNISFIDIQAEVFGEICDEVIHSLQNIDFDAIYIPVSSVRATNYGNIVAICNRLKYKEIIFYNVNGERSVVRKKSQLEEWFIKKYIRSIELIHRR